MPNSIQTLRASDWIVVYVNGKQVTAGHDIDIATLMSLAGVSYAERYVELISDLHEHAQDGTVYGVSNYLSSAPDEWDQVVKDVRNA